MRNTTNNKKETKENQRLVLNREMNNRMKGGMKAWDKLVTLTKERRREIQTKTAKMAETKTDWIKQGDGGKEYEWERKKNKGKEEKEKSGSRYTVQDPESPVPLHVCEPRWVSEAFGERVAVDLQFGDLGNTEWEGEYLSFLSTHFCLIQSLRVQAHHWFPAWGRSWAEWYLSFVSQHCRTRYERHEGKIQ